MKAIRTVTKTEEFEYSGTLKPKFRIGECVRIYCGAYEDHCFCVKDIRFNDDRGLFEYLYSSFMLGGWYAENQLVPISSRKGWHYDSQGYCDNPGRGY